MKVFANPKRNGLALDMFVDGGEIIMDVPMSRALACKAALILNYDGAEHKRVVYKRGFVSFEVTDENVVVNGLFDNEVGNTIFGNFEYYGRENLMDVIFKIVEKRANIEELLREKMGFEGVVRGSFIIDIDEYGNVERIMIKVGDDVYTF